MRRLAVAAALAVCVGCSSPDPVGGEDSGLPATDGSILDASLYDGSVPDGSAPDASEPIAPPSIGYSGGPFAFATGVPIEPLIPESSGGPIASCAASPLPEGLALSEGCVLSGTPAAVFDADVEVTASNASGAGRAVIHLSIEQGSFPVWGSLSAGKLYRFSAAPASDYADSGGSVLASGMVLTDGTRLTDEQLESGEPVSDFSRSVGWTEPSFEIVLDLGRVASFSQCELSASSQTSWDVRFPASVTISTSLDAARWEPYGDAFGFGTDTTGFSSQTLGVTGLWRDARYVRLAVVSAGWTMLDEITVMGTIPNQVRFFPAGDRVYHGAYAASPEGYLDPEGTIGAFEESVGKRLASEIWYGDFTEDFDAPEGLLWMIENVLEAGGRRWALHLGFEPVLADEARIALDEINAGDWDDFLYRWFDALAASRKIVFLRFASEMNGAWAPYGGAQNGGDLESTRKFVAMWRRVYNIAERAFNERGLPSTIAWIWAGNYKSFPDESWNAFESYYPGDGYVDWVGVDVYNGCADACAADPGHGADPGLWIGRVYDVWGDRKPIIVAEAGGEDDAATGSTQAGFVDQLFDAMESRPMVKAFFWFNRDEGGSWTLSGDGLAAYRRRVANPRYVSEVEGR